jgi:mono/diheme cytochrome c family protein
MHNRLLGVCAIVVLLSGCEKAAQNMYNQPKYKPLAASSLWRDGQSARPIEPGTVTHSAGAIAGTSSGRLGKQSLPENAAPTYPVDEHGRVNADLAQGGTPPLLASNPLPSTMDTLKRGQERFNIYCSPCHSEVGDGDGMVVRRGFPRPPSYHSDKLRNAPDAHFFSVITNGYGAMYSYADRVDARDRWAIVAYIRALQLSQNARLADVPELERAQLGSTTK